MERGRPNATALRDMPQFRQVGQTAEYGTADECTQTLIANIRGSINESHCYLNRTQLIEGIRDLVYCRYSRTECSRGRERTKAPLPAGEVYLDQPHDLLPSTYFRYPSHPPKYLAPSALSYPTSIYLPPTQWPSATMTRSFSSETPSPSNPTNRHGAVPYTSCLPPHD